ncbi:MAG TPA: transaldolase family protein [Acidobacteriaceae bacterium]|nr:transaldolase family protein [Acidobacteriaceae bacterium]
MSKTLDKPVAYRSPLHEMTQTTPTCLWNDSATLSELTYAIEHGAVGATCNPVIVLDALKKEAATWNERIRALAVELPTATEEEIGWRLVEEISARRSELLRPVFAQHKGRNGRLSIQTDPHYYRSTAALLEQALRFDALAPNMIVKIPATHAGIAAIEEATYRGISINATVSFTLPQCIAVAEAMERGFKRREKEGLDISRMGPVCTVMVGRLDDWLKLVADKKDIVLEPGYLEWAGVAVFKKAYKIFRERGYRVRLLSAAFRNHMHWSELIGGDVVISPPHKWQVRFNGSDVNVVSRIDDPVDPEIVEQLLSKFPDFRRAYEEKGLSLDEFDTYGPTVRTLRQFLEATHELAVRVRDLMLPNPDTSLS